MENISIQIEEYELHFQFSQLGAPQPPIIPWPLHYITNCIQIMVQN